MTTKSGKSPRPFGPQHYVMAATRYDEDAYMLLEIDRATHSCRFLNVDLVDWSTHYRRAYVVGSHI